MVKIDLWKKTHPTCDYLLLYTVHIKILIFGSLREINIVKGQSTSSPICHLLPLSHFPFLGADIEVDPRWPGGSEVERHGRVGVKKIDTSSVELVGWSIGSVWKPRMSRLMAQLQERALAGIRTEEDDEEGGIIFDLEKRWQGGVLGGARVPNGDGGGRRRRRAAKTDLQLAKPSLNGLHQKDTVPQGGPRKRGEEGPVRGM
uniref:Uncharacterized protein n=2 Tax=Oryza TaxID=4527 RepID=A0A0D3GY82_9ORYZ